MLLQGETQSVDYATPALPARIGHYRLLSVLGKGGMGVVCKANHENLGRIVAIKLISPDRLLSRHAIQRFYREMRAIGDLEHPNVVRSIDGGSFDGTHCLVMDFVDGIDLGKIIAALGSFPLPAACEVIRQTALGLEYIGRKGLVHRDIKPSNLMLTQDGTVKILDLGLAKLMDQDEGEEGLTSLGVVLGTLNYTAPEQASGSREIDIRADIYSLGCTFFKLLTGKAPFASKSSNAVEKIQAHSEQPFPDIRVSRSDIPDGVVMILEKMTAKRPGDRYTCAADLATAIAPFADHRELTELYRDGRMHAKITGEWPITSASGSNVMETSTYKKSLADTSDPPLQSRRSIGTFSSRVLLASVTAILLVVCSFAAIHFFDAETDAAGNTESNSGSLEPVEETPGQPPPGSVADDQATTTDASQGANRVGEAAATDNVGEPDDRTVPRRSVATNYNFTPIVWPDPPMAGDDWDVELGDLLKVHSSAVCLLKFGETNADDFELSVAIRQLGWNGDLALFFGHAIAKDDPSRIRYQVIVLERTSNGKHRLQRRERDYDVRFPNIHNDHPMSSWTINSLDILENRIRVVIRDGAMRNVFFNDQEATSLVTDVNESYEYHPNAHGAFGVCAIAAQGNFFDFKYDGLVIPLTKNTVP